MIRLEQLCFFLLLPRLALAAPEPAPRRVLRLNLETAIQYALRANFQIEISRFDTKIANEDVRSELGRFDPVFDLGALRRETTARSVFENGVRLEERKVGTVDELTSGLTGVTSWGTEYDLGYGTRGTSASRDVFGDRYDTTGSLSLTQPLLRGAGPTVNLAEVRIARKGMQISEWKLRSSIIDIVTRTDFVFNDLQLAIEQRGVAERSRGLAQQLLRDNQARMEIGVKSPLDVTEARAQVAAREEDVILAERKLLDDQNLLKQLVTGDQIEMLGVTVEIEPPPLRKFTENVRGGITDALELRPDYRQSLLELEQQHIRVALQKNALLPRIDLTGSLALLGVDDQFGSSIGRLGKRDQTEWTAGVIFRIPLGNRAARGAYNKAQLQAAKALMTIEALEQQIIVDVDNASGQIVSDRQRIASTRVARALAVESLNAGEERLRAGTGTTFEVLELQEKLARAEAAEVLAVSDYNKAVGTYEQRTGTTLRVHHVELK